MNFLSHYYLLAQKENTDLVIGNLLPDLIRGFTKIYNLEIKTKSSLNKTDLVLGIEYHLQTDKLFHNEDFFHDNCQMLKELSSFYKLPMERNFIVSHVLLELLIDQCLAEIEPSLIGQFYEKLDETDLDKFGDRLKMTLPRQNSSKIISIFKGFREHRYAKRMLEEKGIQTALYHIIGKRIALSFEEPNWDKVIQDGKEKIMKELPSFLEQLKHKLNDA